MFSLEEKEKIIDMIQEGKPLGEISKTQEVPISLLLEWKREKKIRKEAKALIELGEEKDLKLAKKLAEKISDPVSEPIKLSILIKIAYKEGDTNKQIELLKRQLELAPDDVIARSNLIKLTEGKEGGEKRKALLTTEGKEYQNQGMVLRHLISIATENEDVEEEKRLLYKLLEREPKNMKIMSRLIGIARLQGNTEERKRLLERQLETEGSEKTIKNLIRIANENNDKEELNRLCAMLRDAKKINSSENKKLENEMLREEAIRTYEEEEARAIVEARRLIYLGDNDIMSSAEQIKKLLETVEGTDRELVLAELYYHSGLVGRAKSSLKAYKKSLDKENFGPDLKRVNRMLEMVQSGKTKEYEWNGFWGYSVKSSDNLENKKNVEVEER